MSVSLQDAEQTAVLEASIRRLAAAGIELQVTKKRVKNINFRLKPHVLMVSIPYGMTPALMAQAIAKRVSWSIAHHPQVLAQHSQQYHTQTDAPINKGPLLLWGVAKDISVTQEQKTAYYRQQLSEVVSPLFAKWQPIVGAYANEVRLKKMHTRWGSCNTRARRIWLSVYLPAYPIECTEYVIVHELCHLHHANHSRAFWQAVATAMPDYQRWHDKLAGKTGQLE